MTGLRSCFFMTAFALCALLFAAPPAAAENDAAAVSFVQKMGDKALTSLTARELPDGERSKRVRVLLRDNFDVQTIGRFVVGPAWREASESQKKQYMSLFEDMIVETYSHRFKEYSGQSFKVSMADKISDKDSLVRSQIMQTDGPPVSVHWRVRNKNGAMKIVDVIVEDISMSVTQRSDFSAVLQSGGMDGLIRSLKERLGRLNNSGGKSAKKK